MEKLFIAKYVLFYNDNSIRNLGKIEVQSQLFLADWKYFAVKTLRIRKMI